MLLLIPATPLTGAPIQRSMTQPSGAAPFGSASSNPGFFGGRGSFGGIVAGFLGAGLFGLLLGQGFFGGGFASIFGLLLQIALIVIVARLLFARRGPGSSLSRLVLLFQISKEARSSI
jgi:predicted lipid-binding transport protein (Tim44 family)